MATKVLIDTNILVYTFIQNSPFYSKLRQFLENLIQDKKVEVCIAEKSIFEMIAVFSSPAFVSQNLNLVELKEYLAYFTENEDFTILYSSQQTTKITLNLFFNSETKKNRIYDLVLAGIAIENDIKIIYTKNIKDFENIQEIKAIDPLLDL